MLVIHCCIKYLSSLTCHQHRTVTTWPLSFLLHRDQWLTFHSILDKKVVISDCSRLRPCGLRACVYVCLVLFEVPVT